MAAKKTTAPEGKEETPEVKKTKVKLLKPLAPYANIVGDVIQVPYSAKEIDNLIKEGFIEVVK
jgi:hypothetical protein